MTPTTIVPKGKTMIDLTATLTSPFHHGAGSSGNTSLLRTQDVVQPDGTISRVPFLSAASIRHGLRDALAWHLVRTLDIQPGSLTKRAVDLLWSGGAVSSTGARTDLAMMRRVEDHWPALAMLGYAAQSDIITGTLRASDMILVCSENQHRLPTDLQVDRRAAHYRTEEFGTRHDQASGPVGLLVDTGDGVELSTTQMIWDTQALATGSRLHGTISLTPAATRMHEVALSAALHLWAPGGQAHLGAKTAQGYGAATLTGTDWDAHEAHLSEWTAHVTAHADDIHTLITDLGA